jgi:hypothetical protein
MSACGCPIPTSARAPARPIWAASPDEDDDDVFALIWTAED